LSKSTSEGLEALSRLLSQELGISRRRARLFLRIFLEELEEGLRKEGVVHLGRLGRFRVRRGKRGVRVIFRPGKELREALQQVR